MKKARLRVLFWHKHVYASTLLLIVLTRNCDTNNGGGCFSIFFTNTPQSDKICLSGHILTFSGASACKRSTNQFFNNVKWKAVEIRELDTATSGIDVFDFALKFFNHTFFC